ncbi:RimK family alpha-L-glutamate ligase [Candidatus Bathyarchaeota archaeon]|nr:RimK family alpha-L-glutamate ligase [Candidatus Bathyarchaeota archaeon]
MSVGIITRNRNSWSSTQLREALTRRNIAHSCFAFSQLISFVGYAPHFKVGKVDLLDRLDAVIVRPIGRGSLEEIVFRMDMLYKLQRLGLYVLNPPEAIEHCVDKYDILAILEENGIPVPRTAATERVDRALEAFDELGGDIVVKPIFGSRGMGATRVNDREVALTIFKAITFHHGVIYIQEFLPHGVSDIRVFVLGNRAIAAMRRVADSWKTNYSQGARPEPLKLNRKLEEMAVKSAGIVGCKMAGVDIIETSKGSFVVEVNSQPGWKGLQTVTKANIADEIVDYVLTELKK